MGGGRRVLAVGKDLVERMIDFVFPPHCTVCGSEGEWVCAQCIRSLTRHSNTRCPLCRKPCARGFFCFSCNPQSHLTRCLSALDYSDARVAKMVQALKYSFVAKSAPILASVMADAWDDSEKDCDSLRVVSIPLHAHRLAERGFNQAELLAREWCRKTGFQFYADVLIRTKLTSPQMSLAKEDRLKNIHNVFMCPNPSLVAGFEFLLIDDVYTTGATLQEAARVLKMNGAKEVCALTLAHG